MSDAPEEREARALRELATYEGAPRKDALTLPARISLAVAGPCAERWAEMPGDDRVRRCTRCDRPVMDLAGLSADEVASLFEARGIATPTKLLRREDGAVVTSDCDVDRPRRIAMRVLAVVAVGVVASTAAAYALHRLEDSPSVEPAQRSR